MRLVFYVLEFGWLCFLFSWPFLLGFFFFKQKTAYEMRISDWSSDVCSSDLRLKKMRRSTSRFSTRPMLWKVETLSKRPTFSCTALSLRVSTMTVPSCGIAFTRSCHGPSRRRKPSPQSEDTSHPTETPSLGGASGRKTLTEGKRGAGRVKPG